MKLHRAEEHLNALEKAIQQFLDLKPYTFDLIPNPEPPHFDLQAKIDQKPPFEWGPIIGDFAHNARSALDVLVYQLSTLPPDDDKRRKSLQFPICEYPTKDQGRNGYLKSTENRLAGVSEQYRAIIEGFQPYYCSKGFQDDALYLLQKINNTDKHHIVHTIGAEGCFEGIRFTKPSSLLPSFIKFAPGGSLNVYGSLKNGDSTYFEKVGNGVIGENYSIVAKLTIPKGTQMNMNWNKKVEIQFGEGSPEVRGRPVVGTLTLILDRVKKVIQSFESVLNINQ